jgi:hypothetical protein
MSIPIIICRALMAYGRPADYVSLRPPILREEWDHAIASLRRSGRVVGSGWKPRKYELTDQGRDYVTTWGGSEDLVKVRVFLTPEQIKAARKRGARLSQGIRLMLQDAMA